ncbi:MAG: hypothetical protein Q7U94_06385 [Sideroxyarcus sp.]|nr:hypothetical protein [Sideroxyarcus sp.]
MSLTENLAAKLWLRQFTLPEAPHALKMLEKFLFISGEEFSDNLSHLALSSFPAGNAVAFFVERELRTTRSGFPCKMYKETEIGMGRGLPKRLRADGAALPPVESPRNDQQDIGSEGIVASVLSQLCRQNRKKFVLHPSANEIRKRRVDHFVIVTDFIGSGKRALRMLESLWRVRSIRSWHSGGLIKFSVLSYSGTAEGVKKIRKHQSNPNVRMVCKCPTLNNSFKGDELQAITDICRNHSPDPSEPLGYKDTAALIAFEHSCPNNVPAIFHKSKDSRRNPWHPLFPSRVTTHFARSQPKLTETQLDKTALDVLKLPSIATSKAFQRSTPEQCRVVVVLAALSKGYRDLDELVTVTGRRLWEISSAISKAQDEKLVDHNGRPTQQGFALLKRLNRVKRPAEIAEKSKKYYYPTSLRAPI